MDPADLLVLYVGAGAEAIAETSVAALGRDAYVTTCRVSFEEALSTGSGGVACLRKPTPEEAAWLSSLRLRRPHVPLVLVTPLVPASLIRWWWRWRAVEGGVTQMVCTLGSGARRLVSAIILAAGLGCSVERSAKLDGETLLAEASFVTSDEGGLVALAGVRAIHAWAEDSVLILDGLDPFLRVYGRGGRLWAALAPQGEGPGELARPSMMARIGHQFWILNRNGIGIWDATTRSEVGRTAALVGTVAMYEGCGGRPTVLFPGTGPSSPTERTHGVVVHDGQEWIERTELRRSTFTPTWPDFRVARLTDTTFVYFDWEQSMLRASDCDGRVVKSAVVGYPKEWRTTPRPHGLSAVGPWVVLFYSDRPTRTHDTTWVMAWRPDDGEGVATEARPMEGDWRLLGSGAGPVWVLDNRLVPTVFGTPERRFLRWLGVES